MTETRYPLTLLDFMNSGQARSWITDGGLNIYVRKAQHILFHEDASEQVRRCLDFATIEAHEPGNGALRSMLPHFLSLAADADLWLRIENVMVPRFQEFWRKHGFLESYQPGDAQKRLPSFWASPLWEMQAGPIQVHAFRAISDNRMVFQLDGPDEDTRQPQDILPNTEPTLRVWINEHQAVKCSDEE